MFYPDCRKIKARSNALFAQQLLRAKGNKLQPTPAVRTKRRARGGLSRVKISFYHHFAPFVSYFNYCIPWFTVNVNTICHFSGVGADSAVFSVSARTRCMFPVSGRCSAPPAFIVISLVCFRLVSYLFQKCKNPAHFYLCGILLYEIHHFRNQINILVSTTNSFSLKFA